MAITNQPEPFYIKKLPGMNNKADPLELQTQYVEVAQNCRFEDEPGSVVKREPVTYFNSAAVDTLPIVGLYRYYATGVTKFIAVADDTVYVGDDAAGTFTAIRTSMTTGKRMCFKTYKNILLGSNGYDNIFCYDGSSDNITWELGACKAKAGAGTGITATNISYKVTIDADAYVCGAVSNTIATVTNKSIELTNIPLGPVGTTNRLLYRKDSGNDGYRLVTSATAQLNNNTATSCTDTTADCSATTPIPAVTDDMPKGAELQINRERLYVTRDPSNPNRIYFSNPYLPGFIQQTTNLDYLDVSPDDDDEIMGIPVILGVMLCFKKNTIRKLYITGPQANWYSEDPFTYSGTPAPWSITQTPYGIAYLGWDHWYMYVGSGTEEIIDEFDTFDILPAAYADTVGFWDSTELLAAYTDTVGGAQYHDRVMRYNFKRKTLSYDTLNVNCFASKKGDAETGELYYGASDNGYVYKSVNEDLSYKLSTKTDVNTGTESDVYIGGTESSPYLEIGHEEAQANIPTNLIILWDSAIAPGTGWTEITTYAGKYLRIGTPVAASSEGSSASTTPTTVVSYVYLRMFYKDASTTVNTLPDGSIIMWDQSETPEGYADLMYPANYIKLATVANVGTTGTDYINTSAGTTGGVGLDSSLKIHFIKKIGETSTWDGSSKYAYVLSNGVISTLGWADATSTYNKCFLQVGTSLENYIGGDTASSINVTPMSIATKTITGAASSGTGTASGSNELIYDENNTTYYQYQIYHAGDGNATGTLTFEATWTDPISVTSTYINSTQGTYGGNYKDSHMTFTTYLKISGTWTQVDTYSSNVEGRGSNTWAWVTYEKTTSTGWSDVTGIKYYMYGYSYSYEGDRKQYTTLRMHEVKCNGKPYLYVNYPIAKKLLGKLTPFNSSIESDALTSGTWTSPGMQLNPESLKTLSWNESLVGADDIVVSIRTAATLAGLAGATWYPVAGGFTNPNNQSLSTITVGIWVQYKIDFTAADTTVSNPKVYSADGFLTKITYSKGATQVESSVELIYDFGFRNFNVPAVDKIFQKLVVVHEGTDGNFQVFWETENASGNFTISLPSNPEKWSSFFPSTAMGTSMKLKIYKNDLYPFKLKEIQGFYASQPLLI